MSDRLNKMRQIKEEIIAFTGSPLAEERRKNGNFPVIGEGSHEADVVFIGEAPGRNEALTGRPFCGSAGKILDQLLESIELKREEVYITNIVKDRPPNNRDLLPDEIEAYAPFLERQLEIIEPKLIVTLGRFLSYFILEKFGFKDEIKPITQIRGQIFGDKILPLFHPASTIYDRDKKDILFNDFKVIRRCLTNLNR